MLDQAFSSISNFGVSVVAAQYLDARSFGVFALCYSGYLLLVQFVHGLIAEPFMMAMAAAPADQIDREADASVRSAALIGLVVAVPLVAAGVAFGGESGAAAAVLGAGLPVLFVFEVQRWVAFTMRRPWVAAVADAVWLVGLVAAVVAMRTADRPPDTVAITLGIWIGGATVGLLLFLVLLGWPRRATRPWFLRHRRLGIPVAAEFAVDRGSKFLSNVLVGAVISVASVGTLEAARLVYSPLNVLYLGATAALLPDAVSRHAAGDVRGVVRIGRLASAGLLVGTVLYGLAAAALPDSYGEAVLGDRWGSAMEVFVPTTIFFICNGASYGARVRLRAYKAVGYSFTLRLIGSITLLVLTGIGLVVGTVLAVAWALAVAMFITLLLWEGACMRTPEERALRRPAPPAAAGA